MRQERGIFGNIDWPIMLLYLALVLIGWINIYASVYNDEHKNIFDISQRYGKQLIWIATAFFLAISILIIDGKFFGTFAYIIYGLLIFVLLILLVVGNKTAGAQSWFKIGDFKLQPAEFAKFATNLALAAYLSRTDIKFEDFKTKVISFGIILIPMGLVLLQNDTGSALVFFSFIFVLYMEGLSGNILILGVVMAVLFLTTLFFEDIRIVWAILSTIALILYFLFRRIKKFWIKIAIGLAVALVFTFSVNFLFSRVLESHQKDRINVLLGKRVDPKGVGYNVNQSKIAIGSGGFSGKGFLQGTQTKYDFVPEQSTDFIFCTIGEEWGFLGSSFVIALFLALLLRIMVVADRQRSQLSRIYGYGVAFVLFCHVTVNIGMTVGVLPVIGIPLPFMSYGGSSLWAFTIMLFVFVRMDSYRLMHL